MSALLLVAHGSRDARAAVATRALVRAVATRALEGAVTAARTGTAVRAAYLEHTAPSIGTALAGLCAAGHDSATVVPLLLTEAYHGRVDIPAALAEVRAGGLPMTVRCAPVLGPDPLLTAALLRRLDELRVGYDALVFASAGTRSAAARSTVVAAASALGEAAGVPCLASYASAADPTPGDAVAALRTRGARRVVLASYFLAPGMLHDRARASALAAGAVGASAPLGDAPELASLVQVRAGLVREWESPLRRRRRGLFQVGPRVSERGPGCRCGA